MKEHSYLISIIIPFYNRENIIKRLYDSILIFDFEDVEFVFVDDGSTDNTSLVLKELNSFKHSSVQIIKQENKGPGGARNTGLHNSSGKYAWFVDSDDEINIDVYWDLKNKSNDYSLVDFIDYNITDVLSNEVISSMHTEIKTGIHKVQLEKSLKLKTMFGRLVTKVFKRDFLINNNFIYPEYCFYEDNYLIFKAPFYVNSFYKSDICGYIHNNDDNVSITRGGVTDRTFDRLLTAYYGFMQSVELSKTQEEIDIFWTRYVQIFLDGTIMMVLSDIKRGHLKYSFHLKYVYDVFYNEYESLKELSAPFVLKDIVVRPKLRLLLKFLALLPRSKKGISYFERINERSWKHSILIR